MSRFGLRKITLTEEAYQNFRRLKELLGARTWEELSYKLLELVEERRTIIREVLDVMKRRECGDLLKLVEKWLSRRLV